MRKTVAGLLAVLVVFSLSTLKIDAQSAFSASRPYLEKATGTIGISQEDDEEISFSVGPTLGATDLPYILDTSYLNFPNGVAADGETIWITESEGHQITQFSKQGVFQRLIGRTGMMDYQGTTLCWLTDVTLDPDGHLWVVDQCARHVVEFDIDGNVLQELGQLWHQGSGNHQFWQPMGVASDSSGNIYVSDGTTLWSNDEGNHRIQIYDANGTYLNTIGYTGASGAGNDAFFGPRYIFIDDADFLYVVDSGNHRVQILNVADPLSPTYVATLGVTGESGGDNLHLNDPTGVAVTSSRIYVADTQNHRIQVYDRNTYIYQATIGVGYGDGSYQFKNPLDVAVDNAGNIYVVDSGNIRVQQFDSTHTHQRTFGTTGEPYVTDGQHYNHPAGVAIHPGDGSIHLVEESGHRLIKLDASGNLLWTVGEPGIKGWDNDHLHYPRDVAVDDNGNVYVADSLNHRIQVYDAGGSYSETLGSQGDGDYQFETPSGLAVSPDGFLYVADADNHRVQIYDRDLTYENTLGFMGQGNYYFVRPEDVAVDTRGYIYVADAGDARVVVFDAAFDHLRTLGPDVYFNSSFSYPSRLATDQGNNLYVLDRWPGHIYRFHLPRSYARDLIGAGEGDAPGKLEAPYGLAIGSQGGLYVGDKNNQRLQAFVRSAPSIVRTRPISGVTEVPTHRWISVTFNDPMDPDSFNSSTFQLYYQGDAPVPGSVRYITSSQVAVFEPTVTLQPNTRYTMRVTSDSRSFYGQRLKEGRVWSFTTADGEPQLDEGMHFFFGDLHSHSSYSDGQGQPVEAYGTARANGLDFYALTDHAFQLDEAEWQDMKVQADAANLPGQFVGLRGFEYTLNTAGHINVFETADYVQATDPDYDTLEEFYAWLAAQPEAIGQFNHPYTGMNFDDFAYHADVSGHILLTEYLYGGDPYADSLAAGWRVGAVANSDTHEANWGELRYMGVVAPELTREAILESLRARRVFATPILGSPVGLAMQVNHHWMGEIISTTEHLDVEVTLYNPNPTGDILSLVLYDNGSPVVGIVPLPWESRYTWHTQIDGAPEHAYYVQAIIREEDNGYIRTYTGYTAPVWTDNSMPERTYVYLPMVIRE